VANPDLEVRYGGRMHNTIQLPRLLDLTSRSAFTIAATLNGIHITEDFIY
jgi:hypothetical protein